MTDDEGGAHADVHLLAVELLLHHLLSLLADRHQTVDEELGDTRNQLHDSTHDDAKRENRLGSVAIPFLHAEGSDEGAHDDTEDERFAQHAELLLQSFGVDVELREARYLVQEPVDTDGKGHEALAERLRDADAVELIVLLELLCREVSHNQSEHIADDSGEVAPSEALVLDEIHYGADEGEVPIVPQVDVHRACGFRQHHQEVHTQTNRYDQCADGGVVSHGSSCRPSHVEDAELQVVDLRDVFQRAVEVSRQQCRDDAEANETDAYIKTALQRLSELQADAQADDSEQDRHHDGCPE